MDYTLKLVHARMLAALENLSSFERITVVRGLMRENDGLDAALRDSLKAAILELRRVGVSWDEMADKTEVPSATLERLARRQGARRARGVDVQAPRQPD